MSAVLLAGLVACGGGSSSPPPPAPAQSPTAAPSPAPAPALIGPAGGTVTGPNGTQAIIPPGALTSPTDIRIVASNSSLPLPAGARLGSAVVDLLPHGTTFAQPVMLRVPIDRTRVPVGEPVQFVKIDRANTRLETIDGQVNGDVLEVLVSSFSTGGVSMPAGVARQTPEITREPQDEVGFDNGFAVFTATARSDQEPVTYQWMRGTRPLNGETNFSLLLPTITRAADDGAIFSVVVTDRVGRTTTSRGAMLTVNPVNIPPVLTLRPPLELIVNDGRRANLEVVARSSTPLSYQWYIGGMPDPGGTGATYTSRALGAADNGAEIVVEVTNSIGTTRARTFLRVRPPTLIPVDLRPLAAGAAHNLAATPNGGRAWGYNGDGRLGNNSTSDEPLPNTAAALGGAQALATGRGGPGFGLALVGGTVNAWGDNFFGQLGDGTTTSRTRVARIAALSDIVAIAAGNTHAVAVDAFGVVYTWGDGALEPRAVTDVSGATRVAAGWAHTLVARSDGSVWTWGNNMFGQLGAPAAGIYTLTPQRVPGFGAEPGERRVVAVAAGDYHSMALTDTGELWTWGLNDDGQLGDGTTLQRARPVRVALPGAAARVSAGAGHTLALDAVGQVYAWGRNDFGQVGNGTTDRALSPTRVSQLGAGHLEVVAGSSHSLAVATDGTVRAWGRNGYHQLGDNSNVLRTSPVVVLGLDLI